MIAERRDGLSPRPERYANDRKVNIRETLGRVATEDIELEFATAEAARRVRWRILVHLRRYRNEHDDIVIHWYKEGRRLILTTADRDAEARAEQAEREAADLQVARYEKTWPGRIEALTAPVQEPSPGQDEVKDFLMFVGSRYYPTVEDFVDEAHRVGVSKRIGHIPNSMVLGQSRIFLAHEGTQGKIACPLCGGDEPTCKRCRGKGVARENVIFGFFIVSGIDLIVRDAEAEQLAEAITRTGIKLVKVSDAAREPIRGCGYREVGGMYLVSDPEAFEAIAEVAAKLQKAADLEGGIVVFKKPVPYVGGNFMGIRLFDPKEYGVDPGPRPKPLSHRAATARARVTLGRRQGSGGRSPRMPRPALPAPRPRKRAAT